MSKKTKRPRRLNEYKALGCDIVHIKRFEKIPYKQNKSFYHRWFSQDEIKYCLSKKNPYPHFAARFALKEATIKACRSKLSLSDITTVRVNGRPEIIIKNRRSKLLATMAHDGDYAIAVVWGVERC